MVAMSASEARKRLFPLIEQVNDDQEPVEIVSKAGTAYLVSADQWRSLMETAHLLRSPVNAERLLRSIADARHYSLAAEGTGRAWARTHGEDGTGTAGAATRRLRTGQVVQCSAAGAGACTPA